MKKRNRFLSWLLFFAIMVTTFVVPTEMPRAEVIAGEYDTDDPKGFYDTLDKNNKDALFANGQIYFATKAKLATNPNNTRYKTIGYTIKVTNGSHTLHLTVDADGGAYFKNIKASTYNGVEYTLRGITYDNIVTLCRNQVGENAASFQSIFSSSYITITLDAIVTIIKKGEDKGGITAEDGKGGVTAWGERYYLNNSSDLADLRDYGFSNNFESYMNIESGVPNNNLTLTYYADTKANASGTTATVGSGYSIAANGKINGLSTSDTAVRQFQSLTIKTASSLGLKKTGYYLKSGEEWKNDSGKAFKAGSSYMASQINWAVTKGNATTNLYANWKPITYTIKYDANGGSGSMGTETHTFDEAYFMPAGNPFTRRGYTFTGWTLKDSSGKFVPVTASMVKNSSAISLAGLVAPGTLLRNLSTTNGAVLTLEAQWTPNEYEITLNPQAPAGTTMTDYTKKIYILFDTCFSLASGGTSISSLTLPTITGYNFLGYFEGSGEGTEDSALIKKDANNSVLGLFNFITTTYDQDKTFLGQWEPIKSTVTLKADTVTVTSGKTITPATQKLTATYGEDMPKATMPSNPGYTFMGFYTKEGGKGVQYYNSAMISTKTCDFTSALTLYAYWKDINEPTVGIQMEHDGWTNSGDNREICLDKDGEYTGDDVI